MIHVTEDGERVVCPACGGCEFDADGRCEECSADVHVQPQERGEESKS